MSQFKSFNPTAEVKGEIILSSLCGIGSFRQIGIEILSKNGINNLQFKEWYSQQKCLDALKEISVVIGAEKLVDMGKSVVENAPFSQSIDTIKKALKFLDTTYQMTHRNGEVGRYEFKDINETSAQIICITPYPCNFDIGIIEAIGARFKNSSSVVKVEHDGLDECLCRKIGCDRCTYVVSW